MKMDLIDKLKPTREKERQEQLNLPNASSVVDEYGHKCDLCGKTFLKLSNVTRHKKSVHGKNDVVLINQSKETFECRVCRVKFTNSSNRRRHEVKIHNFHPEVKHKLSCSECNELFDWKKNIINHFNDCHPDIVIDKEERFFKSVEDFANWKLSMEKVTASFYAKKQAYTTQDSSVVVETFICHRSGIFLSHSSGKRRLKAGGSNKSGFFCPSNIIAKTLPNGSVTIKFIKTHLGHKCEVSHMALPQSEKKNAGLVDAGGPLKNVMHKSAENSSSTGELETKVKGFQDIANTNCKNLNCLFSIDDVLTATNWVNEMKSDKNSPILCCKLPGKISIEFPSLETQDFFLGFMNEAQEEILKNCGNEIISVDSTHGTNRYDIQLMSIVVKDTSGEDFPIAFLWSNQQSELIFKYFFESIKIRSGEIRTKTFISDDNPAFYNAWISVFPLPQFYLICDWHLKHAWKKNLSVGPYKIKNMLKRKAVVAALDGLLNEMDEFTFLELLKIRVSQWLRDPETVPFGKYFISTYQNRPKQWARCYRIEQNMTVGKWHKDFKYNSNCKGECLDKAIHNLMKSLQNKIMNKLSSLPNQLTKQIADMQSSHKLAEGIFDSLNIYEKGDNEWIVPSFSKLGETYVVKENVLNSHFCKITCDICETCIHQFYCSCPDSAIKYNVCKHIHMISVKKNITKSINKQVESSQLIINIGNATAEHRNSPLEKEVEKNQASVKTEEIKNSTATILVLVPISENITSQEQSKKLSNCITSAKNKCYTVTGTKLELLPVASSSFTRKCRPTETLSFKDKKKTYFSKQNQLPKQRCSTEKIEDFAPPIAKMQLRKKRKP